MPNMHVGGRIHRHQHLRGCGMGSVLLDKGGPGTGSSYESPEEYEQITGQRGLSGNGLSGALSKIMVKPLSRKPGNISFNV